MNKIKSQVLHKIYMLSKARKYLTLGASITVFKSMLLPYFEYGHIFLEICPDRLIEKVDRLFLRAIRIALKDYSNVDHKIILNKMKILPLNMRREISICKLMFNKIQKGEVDILEPAANTRIHDGRVVPWPDVSNDRFLKFIPHLGATIWNKLPSELRNIDDKGIFKSKIKLHYEKLFNPENIVIN